MTDRGRSAPPCPEMKPEEAPAPAAEPPRPVDHAKSLRFGDFEVDLQAGELRHAGERLKLQEKPFQLLAVLLEQPGRVVTREELRQRLWPADTFVDFEAGLNTAVRKLRQALDDSAESPRYVETLPKRGYRFVAPVVREQPADGARAPALGHGGRGQRAAVAAVVVLALAAGVFGVRKWAHAFAHVRSGSSVAVLPFANLSGTSEDDYLADGLTESIITELARSPGLLVMSRNSTLPYRGRPVDIPRVGSDLRVAHVLEGSVQRAGGELRISAQLIDVETGYHLWAQRYDRAASDVFALQDSISSNVRQALRVKLGRTPGAASTTSAEAYDAYLRGRYQQHAEADDWWNAALPYYEQAVALDPQFALAHAALGNACAHVFFYRDPNREWEARAYAEIEKALALDPELAEAYLARGNLVWTWPHRFPHERAVRDYQRALALNPNLAEARVALARLYQHVGLLDESLRELDLALRVDPNHAEAAMRVVVSHLWQHRHAQALAEMEASPAFGRNNYLQAMALSYVGREQEARRFVEDLLAREPGDMRTRSFHAVLLARTGDRARAEREIAQVAGAARNERGYSHYHHAQYNIGSAYAIMGEKGKALQWLQMAADEGFPCYPFYAGDPNLARLHGDPGFEAFLLRLKQHWEGYRAAFAAPAAAPSAGD
jgi:TolB-like protein/DNA-binding winged helix-turn-helix (wHTH) protein